MVKAEKLFDVLSVNDTFIWKPPQLPIIDDTNTSPIPFLSFYAIDDYNATSLYWPYVRFCPCSTDIASRCSFNYPSKLDHQMPTGKKRYLHSPKAGRILATLPKILDVAPLQTAIPPDVLDIFYGRKATIRALAETVHVRNNRFEYCNSVKLFRKSVRIDFFYWALRSLPLPCLVRGKILRIFPH